MSLVNLAANGNTLVKTGGCSEDCSYCAQSSHYDTGLQKETLLPLPQILATAERDDFAGGQRQRDAVRRRLSGGLLSGDAALRSAGPGRRSPR